jgi:hypothetical protein
MENPADIFSPAKSPDEKSSFENTVTPDRTTPPTSVTRFVSEKLLAWGVETRGTYRISPSGSGRP